MAILEGNSENDLGQLWSVITELGEQLSQNRAMSVSLYGLAGKIKVRVYLTFLSRKLMGSAKESSRQFANGLCSAQVCRGLFAIRHGQDLDPSLCRHNMDKTKGMI